MVLKCVIKKKPQLRWSNFGEEENLTKTITASLLDIMTAVASNSNQFLVFFSRLLSFFCVFSDRFVKRFRLKTGHPKIMTTHKKRKTQRRRSTTSISKRENTTFLAHARNSQALRSNHFFSSFFLGLSGKKMGGGWS